MDSVVAYAVTNDGNLRIAMIAHKPLSNILEKVDALLSRVRSRGPLEQYRFRIDIQACPLLELREIFPLGRRSCPKHTGQGVPYSSAGGLSPGKSSEKLFWPSFS
ncbi:MAG: hypothetical protein JW884_01955 [Deltaproteobacteria bacterium]|nr:hypothetical protein [Deltaproteobacteria bacterium]